MPRLQNSTPSTIKWIKGYSLPINYFQHSNVTLLEMFVLNTNCLNSGSVLTAYHFILENLPSVCKYKENENTCSYPIIQLRWYILTTALLHIYYIFSWRFFLFLFLFSLFSLLTFHPWSDVYSFHSLEVRGNVEIKLMIKIHEVLVSWGLLEVAQLIDR